MPFLWHHSAFPVAPVLALLYTSELQGQLPHLLVHLMLSVGATEAHHEHVVAIVQQALHSCYGREADHLIDLHHIVPVHSYSGVPVLLQDPGAFRLWFWHWVHGLCPFDKASWLWWWWGWWSSPGTCPTRPLWLICYTPFAKRWILFLLIPFVKRLIFFFLIFSSFFPSFFSSFSHLFSHLFPHIDVWGFCF